MYISLYTKKHLKRLKQNLFILGVLLAGGGAFAILLEALTIAFRPEWFLAAGLVMAAGITCVVLAQGLSHREIAFFAMDPAQLRFRLTLFGKEEILPWSQISAVRVTDTAIIFELRDKGEKTLPLSLLPDIHMARHIRASISLAALEQNINVNGVVAYPQEAVAF